MKKSLIALSITAFVIPALCLADVVLEDSETFPSVNWTSKNTFSPVTIQNMEGVPMVIFISVSGKGENPAGVNVQGCGDTDHIDAGSSSLCNGSTTDPIILTSDSANPAAGYYQIKKKY